MYIESLTLSDASNNCFKRYIERGEIILEMKNAEILNYVRAGKKCQVNLEYVYTKFYIQSSSSLEAAKTLAEIEAKRVHDGPLFAYVIECPRHLRSDVGNAIMNVHSDIHFVACFSYDIESGCFWIAGRTNNKNINLGEIFSKFPDGGGHPGAADIMQ